jgi:plasmid maintenance system antidote protein VapI
MHQKLADLMKDKNITQADLAKLLDRRTATISDKIRGLFPFSLNEAMRIRDTFFPEYDIDDLFETTDN